MQPLPKLIEVETSQTSPAVVIGTLTNPKMGPDVSVQFGRELDALAEEASPYRILDFSRIETFDTGLVGKLLTWDKKLKARNIRWCLCGVNRELREMFQITRLDKVFDVKPDRQTALQSWHL